MRSLTPFYRGRRVAQRPQDADSFLAFRDEMSRVFDDFLGFGFPSLSLPASGAALQATLRPQMDVSETDDEIQISAELPGLDARDVEVMVDDDVLTIRGKKRSERDQQDRDYHLMERSEGTFSRSLVLPFSIDPGQVQAVFKDGVLTVRLPKPKGEQQRAHRIEVKTADEVEGGRVTGVDRAAAGDKPSSEIGASQHGTSQGETPQGESPGNAPPGKAASQTAAE